MRYDILFGAYPWAFDCPGGGERQLIAYKAHLEAQGHNVTLYDPWKPVPQRVQIFHFFSVMPGSYQLCEYIKNKGLKLIISPNLWVTRETRDHYPHDEIRRLVSIADLLIVNSQLEADALGDVYGLPPNKFHVVYNGVEDGFFEPNDPRQFREHFALGDIRFLLNVANVEPRKNQLRFLEAMKYFPDLYLVVIGSARDKAYFDECRTYGGKQFIYVGPLPYNCDLLRSALAAADGFVMPSTLETPSIAALEAGASGCKVLVTSVGSATEYFGDNVVYTDPDNLKTMVGGISALLNSTSGQLQQIVRDKFTWTRSTMELTQAYQRVIGWK